MKQFVLSDESINSYGFRVLTKGINLKRFNQNPIMYYNHDRGQGVIGRWTDLSIKENKLLGVPVFDAKDALGAKIEGKVKDGFIKAVSIGAANPVLEFIDGEYVVTSCDLQEASICDIPSNEKALMLYIDDKQVTDKQEIMKLCITKNDKTMDLKPILMALGLSTKATIDDILQAITCLQNADSPERAVQQAIDMKLIAPDEKTELFQLAQASPSAFAAYMEKRKEKALQEREENGLVLLNTAIRDGRINANASGTIKEFWMKSFMADFEGTKLAVESLPKRQPVVTLIDQANNSKGRNGWTLQDWRKNAPLELQNNPALYQQLLEQEKTKKNNK